MVAITDGAIVGRASDKLAPTRALVGARDLQCALRPSRSLPMQATRKAQLQIHFCVLLWGFTAILGKLITLPALPLVWWRMLLVTAALLLVPQVWRGLRAMPRRLRLAYAGIGVLVSLHWLTFYAAIKLANASVAATCIALATGVSRADRTVARAAPVRSARAAGRHRGGARGGDGGRRRAGEHAHRMMVGALSALCVALFGSFNKRLVEHGDPLTVTCLELGTGAVFLTLLAPLLPHTGGAFVWPSVHDALLLALLAFACTLLPFALSLVALRHMSAFATQMVTNLEPVYAIVLAIVLLGEQRELDGGSMPAWR